MYINSISTENWELHSMPPYYLQHYTFYLQHHITALKPGQTTAWYIIIFMLRSYFTRLETTSPTEYSSKIIKLNTRNTSQLKVRKTPVTLPYPQDQRSKRRVRVCDKQTFYCVIGILLFGSKHFGPSALVVFTNHFTNNHSTDMNRIKDY